MTRGALTRAKNAATTLRRIARLRGARLILLDSMPRSGSTLVFNALRLCLEQVHGASFGACWIGDLDRAPVKPVMLVKTHGTPRPFAWRAGAKLYVYRDLREVLVSSQRFFGRDPGLWAVDWLVREYEQAKRRGFWMYRYETFVGDPTWLVTDLCRRLRWRVDVAEIIARLPVAQRVDEAVPRVADPITQMHKGHATFTTQFHWRARLSPELLRVIYDQYGWWFEENDYLQ